jgi:hypothetical protein
MHYIIYTSNADTIPKCHSQTVTRYYCVRSVQVYIQILIKICFKLSTHDFIIYREK